MSDIRQLIVKEAREWLGTRFHHQARLKGVGSDCIGLVIGTCRTLGLVDPEFDVTSYPRVPDGKTLIELGDEYMTRIPYAGLELGDVVVIRWGKEPQHFGILGDYLHGGFSMIHAYGTYGALGGSVIEQRFDESMQRRLVACYRLPGVPA